jgi:glycogen debranching enzyme
LQTSREKDNHTIEVGTEFYILATSALAAAEHFVLKDGHTFALCDHYGDIKPVGLGEEGLYFQGTRHLSSLMLRIGDDRPLLLSSSVREDNAVLSVDLTNPDVVDGDVVKVPRGTLHLSRTRYLLGPACYERLILRNYGRTAVETTLSLTYQADFVDIFEVRGLRRAQRGTAVPPIAAAGGVRLAYMGLDRIERRTCLTIAPAPSVTTDREVRMDVSIPPGGEVRYELTIVCENGSAAQPARVTFAAGLERSTEQLAKRRGQYCSIVTSNERFNDWITRSVADLSMLTTDTPEGPYPFAGVPWFSTPFGRDGIITAWSCLWANPTLARGVLSFLASTQADRVDPSADAQPGKILHEMRDGEMAALGEIPFGRYYGSHDGTPLFVMLAAAYVDRTDDGAFAAEIWPHVERALRWIEDYGDLDGDGFVEYARQTPQGLVHQGWKDSHDAVFHRDGELADGPIALCELQALVYGAFRSAARLARRLERGADAAQLDMRADDLRVAFDRAFWFDELGTYALALDGRKQPCLVRSSNAGYALLTGIALPPRVTRLAQTLVDVDSFSGWGIRTIADTESAYNPMSYHNGSVWPHDNALIAYGLSRHGLAQEASTVLAGLFDASLFIELRRLPELFCGFPRRVGESPTLYPVACSPQAWSAAAVFLLVQSVLGLEIDAAQRRVSFQYPHLPPFLDTIRLTGLEVGDASVDLDVQRHDSSVAINVRRRRGRVEVATLK